MYSSDYFADKYNCDKEWKWRVVIVSWKSKKTKYKKNEMIELLYCMCSKRSSTVARIQGGREGVPDLIRLEPTSLSN